MVWSFIDKREIAVTFFVPKKTVVSYPLSVKRCKHVKRI